MFTRSRKSSFLFRISAEKKPTRYLWLTLAGALAVFLAVDAVRGHASAWGTTAFFTGYAIRLFLGKWVEFYADGIRLPEEPSSGTAINFIRWSQIERFHWNGDLLTIVPNTSVLKRGSATPPGSASVRIPRAKRRRVEDLLANLSNST